MRRGSLLTMMLAGGLAWGLPATAEDPTFAEAADAVVEEWSEALAPAFRAVAALPESEFIDAWRAEHDRWRDRLRAAPGYASQSADAERYEARILYEWAFGRMLYPAMHAYLIEDPDYAVSADYDRYLEALDLTRADLLDVEEYTAFLVRKRNMDSQAIIAARGDALNDGSRNLTAKRLANQAFEEGPVRCHLEREALADWLENYAADGLTTQPEDIAAACPGPETDMLLEQVAAERAAREGHAIRIFKTVDGHDLEIHLYTPERDGDASTPAPVAVWLHGGGWSFGSWSWCGPCVWFKERGFVVAQVEYRIEGRHGTTIPDSYADAVEAVAWMRVNAAAFGGDPSRIAVSGFSAGGHLSLAAATFEENGPGRPDLALSFSGCADLTLDRYMRRMAGDDDTARAFSPRFAPNPAAPPLFLANAEEDGDCDFEAARDFAEAATAAGASVTFLAQPDRGHFFLRDPERAAQTKATVAAFLDAHGF